MSASIRPAREADVPALTRIMPGDEAHWPAILATRWTAVHDGDDGVPVGFVTARPGDRVGSGHLSYLFVLPEAQRRGVGSALHDAALGWMAEQGWSSAELRVAADNTRARRFYESRGWVEGPDGPAFDPFLERDMLEYYTSFSIGTSTRLPHSVHDPS